MTPPDTPLQPEPSLRFLRMCDVESKVGLSKRTIQNMVKTESFPKPVQLHERSIGFVESEVEQWMTERMAQRVEIGSGNE